MRVCCKRAAQKNIERAPSYRVEAPRGPRTDKLIGAHPIFIL
jgi:hypothetical protein